MSLDHKALICSRCNGSGSDGHRRCESCVGFGVGKYVGPFWLYWGEPLDSSCRFIRKSRKAVDLSVDFLLSVMVFGGFSTLVLRVYALGSVGVVLSAGFWMQVRLEMLMFWLGVLSGLVWYFRRQRYKERRGQLPLKREFENVPPVATGFEGDAWKTAANLPTKFRRDVAGDLTENARAGVERAICLAGAAHSAEFTGLHLFGGIMEDQRVMAVFSRLGLNQKAFRQSFVGAVARLPQDPMGIRSMGPGLSVVLDAWQEAYDLRHKRVTAPDVLLAAVREDETSQNLLQDFGIDLPKLEHAVSWLRINRALKDRYERYFRVAGRKPKGAMNRAMTAVATPYLDVVSTDLTRLAARGHIDLVVERDDVYEAIYRAVEGGHKSVILVGPHGSGKDTVIAGLAQYMVEEDVPQILQDKRLVSVRLADMISGGTAADAQARLLEAMRESRRSGNIVMAVPGVASVVGVTAGEQGALDLSDVLASELSNSSVFAICTATPEEYTRSIERGRLGQQLIRVDVPEFSSEATIPVLQAKANAVEAEQGVFFLYDAIEASSVLADRYLQSSAMPQKAMMLMKEAAAAARSARGTGTSVTREDVASVVAEKTGVPVRQLTVDEAEKLLNLEAEMHGRVIGQDEAVRAVASAMRRARADVRENKRPIANFLFLGPTGVGKTELAKTLAEKFFGDDEAMIRLDMSEYQDKSAIHRLIGEPTGQQGGFLTEAVRRRPFSLVLLDEVEKAHPDILTVFLQVMDDGRLTDSAGRTVDFTESIIIMTSNAGAEFIQKSVRDKVELPAIKESLMREHLSGTFRPEFLNRFDDIIVFSPLSEKDLVEITRLMLSRVTRRLKDKGFESRVTDEAVWELARAGYDPAFGARPLRRVIQDRVDNPIAEIILRGDIKRRDTIVVGANGRVYVEKAERP